MSTCPPSIISMGPHALSPFILILKPTTIILVRTALYDFVVYAETNCLLLLLLLLLLFLPIPGNIYEVCEGKTETFSLSMNGPEKKSAGNKNTALL